MPYKEPDIRAMFRGDDPGKHIRAGAKDLLERAMVNGIKRERDALQTKWTSTPTLMVQVEQVRYEPPLWRMRTMRPVVEGGQCVDVQEQDPKMLECEMRLKVRSELQRSGYFDGAPFKEQWETARKWAAEVTIEREPLILLRDSQRTNTEWNR